MRLTEFNNTNCINNNKMNIKRMTKARLLIQIIQSNNSTIAVAKVEVILMQDQILNIIKKQIKLTIKINITILNTKIMLINKTVAVHKVKITREESWLFKKYRI